MGRPQWAGPSSAGLWSLIANHRPALEYDWLTRFGLPVSAILRREVSWARAWALTRELLRDPDSHTFASVQGWAWVPGAQARAAVDSFEWWVNAKRGRNQTAFRARRPWEKGAKPEPMAPRELTEDDRRQRAQLDKLLGLA